MIRCADVSLLANIKIDSDIKIDLFKKTIKDASKIFECAHFKVRGKLSDEVVIILKESGFNNLYLYQDIQEKDWVAATMEILGFVKSRSVFLYMEDHYLVKPLDYFQSIVKEFEELKLDYMSYSFFSSGRLGVENILPFYISETKNIVSTELSRKDFENIGKISPLYYEFSLASIVSVEYFKKIIADKDKKNKLYSRVGIHLMSLIFRYPGNRKVLDKINSVIKNTNTTICLYCPTSPGNLEKMWLEKKVTKKKLKTGFLKEELFANFDDDNGAYGESLIKKGIYPFDYVFNKIPLKKFPKQYISNQIVLSPGQEMNLLYYSTINRISKPPIIHILVTSGNVVLKQNDNEKTLLSEEEVFVYGNMGGTLSSISNSNVRISVYDEVFED